MYISRAVKQLKIIKSFNGFVALKSGNQVVT